MSCLLPSSVHDFLGNVESSLCLPILLVMLLCTLQLVFYQVWDIKDVVQKYFESSEKLDLESERRCR